MKRKSISWSKLVLPLMFIIVVILFASCSVADKKSGEGDPEKPNYTTSSEEKKEEFYEDNNSDVVYKVLEVGDLAPDFSARTLDGEEIVLSDLRGRVVLINFWASWCSPCVSEMPEIQKLYDSYSRDELEIIAVNVGEKENRVTDFAKNNPNYSFHIVVDDRYVIGEMYPTSAIPYTVIVSPSGTVAEIFLGSKTYEAFSKSVNISLDN